MTDYLELCEFITNDPQVVGYSRAVDANGETIYCCSVRNPNYQKEDDKWWFGLSRKAAEELSSGLEFMMQMNDTPDILTYCNYTTIDGTPISVPNIQFIALGRGQTIQELCMNSDYRNAVMLRGRCIGWMYK